ncbi:MAG: 50S ribosomal protein L22 [Patescibacteria group bacterium]
MEVKAKAKQIRMSPRKTRLVIDIVRGLDLGDALSRLSLLNKKAAKPILKLLKSALANAENNFNLEKSNLFVREIKVDGGQILYRWMPKAQGRATPIRKRTSIISVILGEKVSSEEITKKKSKKIPTQKVSKKKNEATKEKVEMKQQEIAKDDVSAKKEDIVNVSRKAGRVEPTKTKNINAKKEKGVFKKVFRRKSGM